MTAFINTTMIRNLEFNDRYPGGHPSDCLGAILALGGGQAVDGQRLLTSMIVASARQADGGGPFPLPA